MHGRDVHRRLRRCTRPHRLGRQCRVVPERKDVYHLFLRCLFGVCSPLSGPGCDACLLRAGRQCCRIRARIANNALQRQTRRTCGVDRPFALPELKWRTLSTAAGSRLRRCCRQRCRSQHGFLHVHMPVRKKIILAPHRAKADAHNNANTKKQGKPPTHSKHKNGSSYSHNPRPELTVGTPVSARSTRCERVCDFSAGLF